MIHVEVSGRIREAREVAGLTQERFAELIRILPQNVSCAEGGLAALPEEKRDRNRDVATIPVPQDIIPGGLTYRTGDAGHGR